MTVTGGTNSKLFIFVFLFLKKREREQKDKKLDGYGDGEDLAGTEEGESSKYIVRNIFFSNNTVILILKGRL